MMIGYSRIKIPESAGEARRFALYVTVEPAFQYRLDADSGLFLLRSQSS